MPAGSGGARLATPAGGVGPSQNRRIPWVAAICYTVGISRCAAGHTFRGGGRFRVVEFRTVRPYATLYGLRRCAAGHTCRRWGLVFRGQLESRSWSLALGHQFGSGCPPREAQGYLEKGNSHGTRPVHLIITMIEWIRTSRLTMKNSLSVPVLLESGPIAHHGRGELRVGKEPPRMCETTEGGTSPRIGEQPYRGTSLIRNSAPLGPYSRTMPRALWWS